MKTIKVKGMNLTNRDIDELEHFQGNLKDLPKEDFEKLKSRIEKNGFAAPIFVWVNDGVNHILDGHQRLRTLKTMRETGYEIPAIPVVEIDASDIKEAREMVIQFASVYGRTNEDGFIEFLNLAEIPLDFAQNEFRLPDMHWAGFFESYKAEPSEGAQGSREIDGSDFNAFAHQCPKCSFQFD